VSEVTIGAMGLGMTGMIMRDIANPEEELKNIQQIIEDGKTRRNGKTAVEGK
jgi:hypothetical protein